MVDKRILQCVKERFPNGGTILEFGIGGGSSLERIAKHIPNSRLIAFDSFQGLPAETSGVYVLEQHKKGAWCYFKEEVLFRMEGRPCEIIEGWFKDTLTFELQETISDLIFVNIDVDLYGSTMEVLDFIQPLLRTGVIIHFDDWIAKSRVWEPIPFFGERLAFSHWIENHPEIKYESIPIRKQQSIEIL